MLPAGCDLGDEALGSMDMELSSVSFPVSGFANLYQNTDPGTINGSIPPVPVPSLCLAPGGQVDIVATGCVIDAGSFCTGPNGSASLFRGLPVYSLIGRWSTNPAVLDNAGVASPPFFVGAGATLTAPAGTGPYYLFLADNDGIFADNGGAYSVTASWADEDDCGYVANNPPVADAGADQGLSCQLPGVDIEVSLDGTGSSDPDGDALTYQWLLGGVEIASGATATASLPAGTHVITLVVTDPSGASASDEVSVTLEADTAAPQVTTTGMLLMQFPRTYALEQYTLSECVAADSDECTAELDINANGSIVSIASDEAVITANHDCDADPQACIDIEIIDNSTFRVRNTRDGYGDGRVYTVSFTVADDAGNSTDTLSCQLGVRLWGTHVPTAGAPAYTVYP